MPPPPPTIHLPHLDQSNESDLHLLTRLARRWDYVFKLSGKRLAFVPAGKGLAASGEPVSAVTIQRDQTKDYRATLADRGKYRSVEAHWQDQEEGKRVSERVGEGDRCSSCAIHTRTPSRPGSRPSPAWTSSPAAGPP